MWVIWIWMFPEHGKKSNIDISSNELPENVSPIPTELNMQTAYGKEYKEFLVETGRIIDNIINNWIGDYLDRIKAENNPENIKKYTEQTDKIHKIMEFKAIAIDETIDYLQNAIEREFDNEFVLSTIDEILCLYREEVFILLLDQWEVQKDDEHDLSQPPEGSIFDEDYDELQKKLDWIVQSIIDEWISDYLASIKQINTPLTIRKYDKDTNHIYNMMIAAANTMDDTIICIEDEIDELLGDENVFKIITEMLNEYRRDVFDLLVKKYG